jgi:hypothetical protein
MAAVEVSVRALSYALSMLLNRARLIWIWLLPFLAADLISLPMCSPSRSQSVQMTSASARLA